MMKMIPGTNVTIVPDLYSVYRHRVPDDTNTNWPSAIIFSNYLLTYCMTVSHFAGLKVTTRWIKGVLYNLYNTVMT
jgi:hypothetical protein